MKRRRPSEKGTIIPLVKTVLVFVIILFVLALKFGYIDIFRFEDVKKFFHYDQKIYSYLARWVEGFVDSLSFSKPGDKNILSDAHSSSLYIYPADGQIQASDDGGYYILIEKKTDIFSPCDGKVTEIAHTGETFDIVIQYDRKVYYRVENISVLNVQVGKVLKKGEAIGYKLPFDLTGKDFIYFKREEIM